MSGKRLLVVDDEPRVIEGMTGALRDLGYEVKTLDSPFGLLAELRESEPDAIILDIHMPGLSGDSLLSRVRNSADYGHIKAPFIFVSGLSPERLESVGRKAAADGWLSKPVDIDEMDDMLRRLIGEREALRAS